MAALDEEEDEEEIDYNAVLEAEYEEPDDEEMDDAAGIDPSLEQDSDDEYVPTFSCILPTLPSATPPFTVVLVEVMYTFLVPLLYCLRLCLARSLAAALSSLSLAHSLAQERCFSAAIVLSRSVSPPYPKAQRLSSTDVTAGTQRERAATKCSGGSSSMRATRSLTSTT